ncbi:hypothetical protein IFR04_016130 [Cadophora malorum]|uniref:Uncharacterized protein n=1 Tax=Cadophora malorum TaxID=108018 RepID=A0A8H7T0E5_9HELO|nr:hypothetical protein IFR04_016130 [Cadophora malorum]
MSSVAVIGLGAMGGTLAARLVECGMKVHGYDISRPAIERLQAKGGKASANLEQAISGADVVICNLPNDEILLSVVSQGGMINMLKSHQSFVEMSTILPATMIAVSKALQGKVREVVDAPVSGGPPEAKIGKLSLLVGAERDLESRTYDVLSKLGTVLIVGKEAGSGKAMKLVNNMISMSNTAIAMEAMQLGRSLDLDYETMYNVLSKSGAASTMLNKRGQYVLDDDFTARFEVSLAEKDTRLALQLAQKLHFPTPLLANVHQRYETAMASGLAKQDICALIKLYRPRN